MVINKRRGEKRKKKTEGKRPFRRADLFTFSKWVFLLCLTVCFFRRPFANSPWMEETKRRHSRDDRLDVVVSHFDGYSCDRPLLESIIIKVMCTNVHVHTFIPLSLSLSLSLFYFIFPKKTLALLQTFTYAPMLSYIIQLFVLRCFWDVEVKSSIEKDTCRVRK